MIYHSTKSIFYLFFLFMSYFPAVDAKIDENRLNKEMDFLKKYASTPFVFLPEEEIIDKVSTKQAGPKRTDRVVDGDSMLKELEEETGPFKPSPPNYTN